MLYIKLFIEREKNIGQSAPECPFKGVENQLQFLCLSVCLYVCLSVCLFVCFIRVYVCVFFCIVLLFS